MLLSYPLSFFFPLTLTTFVLQGGEMKSCNNNMAMANGHHEAVAIREAVKIYGRGKMKTVALDHVNMSVERGTM